MRRGVRLTYIGDGNNVAVSLALACARVGAHFTVAAPAGYELPADAVRAFEREAAGTKARLEQVREPRAAAEGAQVLYTDVWTSMGQEAEKQKRLADFAGFQLNAELLALSDDAIVLHCLPAHYGEEITKDVSRGLLGDAALARGGAGDERGDGRMRVHRIVRSLLQDPPELAVRTVMSERVSAALDGQGTKGEPLLLDGRVIFTGRAGQLDVEAPTALGAHEGEHEMIGREIDGADLEDAGSAGRVH